MRQLRWPDHKSAMSPRDLFMGLRGLIGGARGSQGVERASKGSHGAIGLV